MMTILTPQQVRSFIIESEGRDTLRFGEGISINDLLFSSSDNNLTIHIKGDNSSGVAINDFYKNNSNKIDVLEFSDGTSIDISTYNSSEQLIQAMSSFGSLSSSNLSLGIQEFQIIENVITANSLKGTAA